MKQKMFNLLVLLIGIFGIYLFFDHMLGFRPHDYFYIQNPNIEKYIGTNVVSMFADLSFFTYHTIIFFSLWLIMFAISNLFSLNKLNNFIRNYKVISFVFVNYLVTCLLYTIFELTSGNITFGLYALTPNAIYNFVTNLIIHYGYFILSVIFFIKVKGIKSKKQNFYHLIIVTTYLLIYFIIVKLTGMYAYQIEWYPYPIFDVESIAKMLLLSKINYSFKVIIFVVVLMIILCVYIFSYQLLIKHKNKNSE